MKKWVDLGLSSGAPASQTDARRTAVTAGEKGDPDRGYDQLHASIRNDTVGSWRRKSALVRLFDGFCQVT